MISYQIPKCPCGGNPGIMRLKLITLTIYEVVCPLCGGKGGSRLSKSDALSEWIYSKNNERTDEQWM